MMYPLGMVSFPVFRPFDLEKLRAVELRPRELLLGPWLREGSLTLLHGPRGVGKTRLVLAIAHAVATGAGLLGWAVPRPRRVLFLDGEMTIHDLQRAVRGLPASAHDGNLRILANDDEAEPLDLTQEPHRQRLEPHLDCVDLVIVDNLGTLARGGSENAAESWAPVEGWALGQRRRNRAVLFVHNSGRLGQQRGTTRREDRMDTILALRPDAALCSSDALHWGEAGGSAGARFDIHAEKHRGSLPGGTFPLRTWLGPEGWRSAPVAGDPRQDVVALTHAGHSVREIAGRLGLSASMVNRLQHAARDGGVLAPMQFVPTVSAVSPVSPVPNGVPEDLTQAVARVPDGETG